MQEELNRKLLEAAKKGDIEAFKGLIAEGSDAHYHDKDGMSALLWAAWFGRIPMVEYLLKNGSEMSERDNLGCSPLLLAAASGEISMVEYLIKNKLAEISEKSKEGSSPLLQAALNGHIQIVEYLLKNGSEISERNHFGNSPLLMAALNGQVHMVKYLLNNTSAKMSERNNERYSPLLLAAANGQILMVEHLIDNGLATMSERGNHGSSPLLLAACNGHIRMVEYLLKKNPEKSIKSERTEAGNSLLLMAAANGHLPMVKYLLKEKLATMSERNNEVYSPLLLAAENGQISVLEYFLENKLAEVSEKTNHGFSSLLLAAYDGHISTVQYLLKKGAPVDMLTNSGYTISLFIQEHPHAKKVALPIIMAAETLLKLAPHSDGNSPELSNALKTLKGAINGTLISNGNSALHLAVLHKNKALVQLLLEHGADMHLVNNSKSTPLQLGLSSEVPYIQHCFNLAKLNELSKAPIAIQTDTDEEAISDPKEAKESKESKEFKESLEKVMIQPEVLDKLIEETFKGIQKLSEQGERNELLYKLGVLLSKVDRPSFRPLLAYEIFNTITPQACEQYEDVHFKYYKLIKDGHIIISKAKDKLETKLEKEIKTLKEEVWSKEQQLNSQKEETGRLATEVESLKSQLMSLSEKTPIRIGV